MNCYSSVTMYVSPKNPISKEKMLITSKKTNKSFKQISGVLWSKKMYSYMFLEGISWQISSNWLFQRNVVSDLERAQTSDHCYMYLYDYLRYIMGISKILIIYFLYFITYAALSQRETVPKQTSDMGKKTVSVLAHSF